MIRDYVTALFVSVVGGCAMDAPPDVQSSAPSSVASEEQAETAAPDFHTGCDDQPPCECALKGSEVCIDHDGDGFTLGDNCPWAYNPDQQDCDGDGVGDVCDGDNAVLWQSSEYLEHQREGSFGLECRPASAGPNPGGALWQIQHWILTYRTDKWANLCGPSGSGTVSRGFSERTSGLECQVSAGASCQGPAGGWPGFDQACVWLSEF